MVEAFQTPQDAALAALNKGQGLTRRNGQFLGQIVGDQERNPLSERQRDWLDKILIRADLPPLADGGDA